ncbi:MAG TPA: peptidyl-prolyl cis-trans isomerase [Candidatus Omnitrophota bacterium]|nr:peptidyl-prolyl cis-trans isomerase [Candidatus Omnitrophota bacterium]HPD85289.1 peptidyl-prolyl cis-trans isomerase [Candidatus Omnitrophota bacterium]HRZ04210.1 peptidyl-prolyl cis-trans isomerase [Candidatus Omnitrophota bacterium]
MKTSILVFLLILAGLPSLPAAAQTVDDAIIAVVNSDVITLKDLHEYLSAFSMQLSAEGKTEEEMREITSQYAADGLTRLIEDRLIVDEANRKGIIIRPKLIEDKINEIKKQYPSDKEFIAAVTAEGLTLSDLRKKITDQFKTRYIIDEEIKSKIQVSPQEVTDYYQKNIDQFQRPESVDLLSIAIPHTDSDKAEAQQRIEDAMSRIKKGEDFIEIAKQYSRTPSVGLISKGQTLPDIENVVFKLKEGEVSPVVETATGLYIFKAKQKYPPRQNSLDDVKDNIYGMLFQQKMRYQLTTWIEGLKKNAYIEIKK